MFGVVDPDGVHQGSRGVAAARVHVPALSPGDLTVACAGIWVVSPHESQHPP
jgi:hypothetical protein